MNKTTNTLDLRGVACPMNFVRAKLFLEQMEPGALLEVIIDQGDPLRHVPASLRTEGHEILAARPLESGFQLLVRRGAGA
ncbi:MAG: sulfurtransferase TusA family protein [Firmicutes bacterium]|nr:sulfurtransferase TusA family protein [Bacillota bacterium]MCL5040583.1 sulfurtransferase TusA family protein [Bacillota bacterium]